MRATPVKGGIAGSVHIIYLLKIMPLRTMQNILSSHEAKWLLQKFTKRLHMAIRANKKAIMNVNTFPCFTDD